MRIVITLHDHKSNAELKCTSYLQYVLSFSSTLPRRNQIPKAGVVLVIDVT